MSKEVNKLSSQKDENLKKKAQTEPNSKTDNEVMIDELKNDRKTRYILGLAQRKHVKVIRTSKEEINKLCIGHTSGGIITSASSAKAISIKNINLSKNPTIFLIDGIEDPYNLGYTLRSLYAFGINTCIIKNQHLISADNIIVKSSAGASEMINFIISDDIINDLNYLKNQNYKMALLKRNPNSKVYYQYDLSKKLIVAIGGEKRGLSKDIEELANDMLYIPYANDFKNSLNATSAIVTIASEIYKQRNK